MSNYMSKVNGNDIKVAINCLVYNHEPYLRDSLEGFVMQQTDFPFVAIVHDDASTDHSADIIREYAAKYPDIIHPIYETENQYSKKDGSLTRIMDAAIAATGADYIALCEGDDYWTDPHKLQKQVDFLEAHPKCAITSHRYKIYDHERKVFEPDYLSVAFKGKEKGSEICFLKENYLDFPYLQTMTVVYRASCWDYEYYMSLPRHGDLSLFYVILRHGYGTCMNFDGAVYRQSVSGVYAKKSWSEKHYIGFGLYSDMYLYTKDVVFLPHAMSHTELVFADIKRDLLMKQNLDKTKYRAILLFLWKVGERKTMFKYWIKLKKWSLKAIVAGGIS